MFFQLRPQLDKGGTIQFYAGMPDIVYLITAITERECVFHGAESQTMTLDDQVYSKLRAAVLAQLGQNAQALVDAILI